MFIKGKSGNPKGGYSASHKLSHLVRLHSEPEKLIAKMNKIALNEDNTYDVKDQLQAIKELLDRGWGKPPQTVTIETPIEAECFDTSSLTPEQLDNFEALMVAAGAVVPDVNRPDGDAEDQ